VLYGLHPLLDEIWSETLSHTADDAASVAPLVDVAQGAQDRLYSRLFQS
jgi:urease accessory protein UreF